MEDKKIWKIYAIRSIWTGRGYIGLTGKPDVLDRMDEHIRNSHNEELLNDFKMCKFPRKEFHIRVVSEHETEKEASDEETRLISEHVKMWGCFSLYNRIEGGLPKYYDDSKKIPKFIRDQLLTSSTRNSEKELARIVRKAHHKIFYQAQQDRQKHLEQKKIQQQFRREAYALIKRKNKQKMKDMQPYWMKDESLLPKIPPPTKFEETNE